MKLVTGINKWAVVVDGELVTTTADQDVAEARAVFAVESDGKKDAYVLAYVSKFALPPVKAVKVSV